MAALPFSETQSAKPQDGPRRLIIVALAVLLLTGLVAGIFFFVRSRQSKPSVAKTQSGREIVSAVSITPRPTRRTLAAYVDFYNSGVLITNRDTNAWHDCSLEMHSDAFQGEYLYGIDTLGMGDSMLVPYTSFKKGNESLGSDARDPQQQLPQGLAMYCQNIRGKEGWNYFFR